MKKSIRSAYIYAAGLTTTICLWVALSCMSRHEYVNISFDTSNRFDRVKTAVIDMSDYISEASDVLVDMTEILANLTKF